MKLTKSGQIDKRTGPKPEAGKRMKKLWQDRQNANRTCINTDRELWREREGDYYADSIHVTEHGAIGINCGGLVIVAPLKRWHEAMKIHQQIEEQPISAS